ncbi:hypothetical protein [Acuticoccus sp.]|uniref:hypothetical protein n=1 Tax=Acuticoccus sp. TaxID=1904378 RepID=UPI003B5186E1
MAVSYALRSYWCASRMVNALTPRVAVRYLNPRIRWAADEHERRLLMGLRDRVQADERATFEPIVLPLPRPAALEDAAAR